MFSLTSERKIARMADVQRGMIGFYSIIDQGQLGCCPGEKKIPNSLG
jgi:hypothetical protein